MVLRNNFSKSEEWAVFLVVLIFVNLMFLSFTGVIKDGRDSRRRSDVMAMNIAYKLRNEENNYKACGNLRSYFKDFLPDDPLGEPIHSDYQSYCGDEQFCVCAKMEISGSGNSIDDKCNFSAEGKKDWFCVTRE